MADRKACLALFVAAAGGHAMAAAPDRPSSAVMRSLKECRSIADVSARADCYDRQVDALETAEAKGDVVVVDRAGIRKARRSLFGLSLPSFDLFSKGDSEADKAEFTQIDTTIAQVSGSARVALTLEDGARWIQTDDEPIASPARPGDAIRIRRGAMGSFLANIKGQRAIRVRRVN